MNTAPASGAGNTDKVPYQKADRRTPALDGVRGIAIAAVMLLHAAAGYFPGGAIGVDVFFVLSAFFITRMIIREVREGTGSFAFGGFYCRRMLRLAPALVMWLLIIAAPTALFAGQGGEIVQSTLLSVSYVGNWAIAYDWLPLAAAYTHVWSLAIEEQFYLLWPVLLVFVVMRWPHARRRILTGAVAAAIVAQILASQIVANAYFLPWGHIVALATGCLVAEWTCYGVPRRVLECARQVWMVIVVLAAIGLMCVWSNRIPSGITQALLYVAVALAIGILILHGNEVKGGAAIWILTIAPLVWLGRRSYGLYLYHRTLAQLVPSLAPGIRLAIAGPLVILLSFAIAELSYRFVEGPVMRSGYLWLKARHPDPGI